MFKIERLAAESQMCLNLVSLNTKNTFTFCYIFLHTSALKCTSLEIHIWHFVNKLTTVKNLTFIIKEIKPSELLHFETYAL